MDRARARRIYVVALVTGALFIVGVAFAQWVATGTGTGYAKAGVAEALTSVDVSASAVGDLYPGTSGTLTLRISNPNPYPVEVTSVTGAGSITSDVTGCGAYVTFTNQTGLSLAVPAEGAATHALADAVAMSADSPSSCAGAGFAVPVSLSGLSGEGTTTGDTTDPGGGEPVSYYTGPAGSEGVGECKAGTKDSEGNVVEEEVVPSAEVPDGLDNDCDGMTDEDIPVEYRDADADGFGDSFTQQYQGYEMVGDTAVYSVTSGWVENGYDCDDSSASIHPDAPETLDDGIDSNCDSFDNT